MNENMKILSEIANEFLAAGDIYDLDKNKSEILFPFFEEILGYDALAVGDIVVAPAYTSDGTYKLDYGLRSNTPGVYKSCFKVINRGEKFEDHVQNIKKCLVMAETEFVVITDCFEYKFFAYDDTREDIIDIGFYSLINPEECDYGLIPLIECPKEKVPKQEFAVRDDEPEDLGLNAVEEPYEPPVIPKKKTTPKKKKKTDKKIFVIGGVIIALLVLIIILAFATRGEDGKFFSELPIIGSQSGIEKGQLDGKLSIGVNDESIISMGLYSRNIPAGGVIKFELTSGTYQDAVYGSIGSDGNAYANFTIPGFWDEETITVIAYLRFDEGTHAQPSNIKAEFGEIGEKIIGKDGAPDKFAITYGTITHNSQAVRDKLAAELLEKERREREERLKVFGSLNIRVDSVGNWKILPAEYDMNESNITKSVNIYPQVFYNASDNAPYFYLVCGDLKANPILFTDIIFYADGYQWAYEIANDIKEVSVNNGVWKEWAYLDNYDFPDIVDKAKLLGSSDVSKITFKGNQIVEHVLSQGEKNNILTMIAAYNTYFNIDSAPKSEWYIEYMESKNPDANKNNQSGNVTTNSNVVLNYIKKPISVYERESNAEKELNNLLIEIQNKRLQGQTVSASEEAQLEIYMNRYKVLTEELIEKFYKEIVAASGELVETPDFENLKDGYYKFYFEYNTPSAKIENGYINEVYLLPNQTVYLPIKSVVGAGEKGYASFKISNQLYKELLYFISTTDYELIS